MTGTLATLADYELLTGVDVPTNDEPRVTALLEATTGAIQVLTGQTLLEVVDDVITVCVEPGWPTIVLPEVPVTAVAVVDPSGDLVPADHYSVEAAAGLLKHCDCRPWDVGEHTITYTHGYNPVPPDLVAYTVGVTQRGISAPAGVRSQSVGSYSVTYSDNVDAGGSAVLDAYRA